MDNTQNTQFYTLGRGKIYVLDRPALEGMANL